jgi:hypothetical protein
MFIAAANRHAAIVARWRICPAPQGARMTRAHADCRNFPSRLIRKAQLNFTAFCQASLARAFHAIHADVELIRAMGDCIIGTKTRRNPVLSATQ